MKMVHGTRSEEDEAPAPETQDFKICPICGATCFADMEVCFGCLHHFEGDESLQTHPNRSNALERPELHPAESEITASKKTDEHEASPAPARIETIEAEKVAEIPTASFDHTRDIPSLKRPHVLRTCSPDTPCKNAHEDAMTSHHICSDGEGRQFEISISVKLL